jgi:hypothetical protein
VGAGDRRELTMDKRRHLIVGVHITDRVQSAPGGLILLDMICDPKACQEMVAKLTAIAGVEVQQMAFDH